MKRLLLLCSISALSLCATSQVIWTDVSSQKRSDQVINPSEYRTVETGIHQLVQFLYDAPHELEVNASFSEYIFTIPAPDGTMMSFKLVEAPVMAPELQSQFPSIRSYAGQGIEDPTATLRCSISQKGFQAMVLSANGTWYIDPIAPGQNELYISYTREAFYATTEKVFEEIAPISADLSIDIDTFEENLQVPNKRKKTFNGKEVRIMGQRTTNGTQLRTYRLALACTGEYATFHGGTTVLALAAMNASMTRVNGVYEKEVSIRMVLVPNNNLLVYLNAATDPYTNGNGSTMLGQNQTTCNSVIGTANYDIGHVFSTGGGGVASLNSPCSVNKARGVTGQVSPIGDPFDIDYVAHEMGHQFGGNHTQNNPCNRASSAAYEPGSASTIMGYAGICSPDLQSNSDAYFHNRSFNEIYNFSVTGSGNSCAALTSTGNTPPLVEAGTGGFTIPISTPFELTAIGSDADSDVITYCWEQFDLGPATATGDNNLTNPSGNQPIFRSWTGTVSPTRVFPRIPDLVNNTVTIGEHMPTYDRSLAFKCTARDNRVGGGGVTDDLITFNVDNVGGPFVVTAPNVNVTWPTLSNQTITWSVANTTAAPISCPNVNIYLSTDGGYTFPTLLLANTPNDGSQNITIPNTLTSQARIKVKAANNIFFDISNTNFTISAGGGFAEDLLLGGITSPIGAYCGDEVTPEITVNNIGSATITSFTVQYNVDGGANSLYNWNGSLANGASINVIIPLLNVPGGSHAFNVNIINPNGTTDDNPINNSGSSLFSTITNATVATLTILTDCWGEEVSWNIENSSNVIIYSQAANTLADQSTFNWEFCLPLGCYDFNIFDSFGDGLDGTASGCPIDGSYSISDDLGNVLVQMGNSNYGSSTTHNFCVPVAGEPVPGCTDPIACNYNPAANVNNGSCTYPGCNNPLACNYNALAGCSNGSCVFAPMNDLCSGAIPLVVNGTSLSTNNIGTCAEGPNPSCGGTAMQDVWFSFLYTGGNITISTSLGTNSDTRIALWSACGGTQIACDDDLGPGLASLINVGCPALTSGNTYYIQAGGFNSIEGTFGLQVSKTNVLGCTDPQALNFAVCANVDDGSCVIPGCIDILACNYDSQATQDDGSCVYSGCTNPLACNYNVNAGCDNGSCTLPGCTDPIACNYNVNAGCNNGSCVYPGCTNPLACNYNVNAGCDNGSCTLPGCNDPIACNYNVNAGCNNGSCVYPGCTNPLACNYNVNAGCDNGSCILPGCTDPIACNYNVNAGCDNGSCTLLGCIDPIACNYNVNAGCDDGSCDYSCLGCIGDFNDDGTVGITDLLILLSAYGCSSNCGEPDLSSDGLVGTADLLIFLSVYGTDCP